MPFIAQDVPSSCLPVFIYLIDSRFRYSDCWGVALQPLQSCCVSFWFYWFKSLSVTDGHYFNTFSMKYSFCISYVRVTDPQYCLYMNCISQTVWQLQSYLVLVDQNRAFKHNPLFIIVGYVKKKKPHSVFIHET